MAIIPSFELEITEGRLEQLAELIDKIEEDGTWVLAEPVLAKYDRLKTVLEPAVKLSIRMGGLSTLSCEVRLNCPDHQFEFDTSLFMHMVNRWRELRAALCEGLPVGCHPDQYDLRVLKRTHELLGEAVERFEKLQAEEAGG